VKFLKNRKVIQLWIGFLVTLLCFYAISRQIRIREIQLAFQSFNYIYLLYGVAFLTLDYIIRIYRWSYILRAIGAQITTKACAGPFMGSIALNNLLPFRAGDGIRAFFYPEKMKIDRSMGVSSLVMEKISDLSVLGLMLLVGVVEFKGLRLPKSLINSTWFLIVILLLFSVFAIATQSSFIKSIIASFWVFKSASLVRIRKYLARFQKDMAVLLKFKPLFSIFLISSAVWITESFLGYFILRGFGLLVSPAGALLFMSLVSISTLVPSSPGYVGPFDLAVITSVGFLGGTAGQGISVAIVLHLSLWFPTTVAGAFAILKDAPFFREARIELQSAKR